MKIPSLFIALLLAACRTAPVSTPVTAPENHAAPLPDHFRSPCAQRICTQQYDPVCVISEHEGRILRQTFANDCHICGIVGTIVNRHRGACGDLL